MKDFRRGQHNEEAGTAECAFHVLEAEGGVGRGDVGGMGSVAEGTDISG